ncbi:tyrosine recombinase XerC [Chryseobacterium sp. EO14]|uniref:site-specific integrase n=1 Tax=Chryseobacterium sp. EO14 TaxID=2950551 RepID=UPI00210A80D5|nr:site-specific integrase [Chryseobacterium sp. EO14]MCQ4139246.1 site-specific integrase [Chryseobacterium sp. EO14]
MRKELINLVNHCSRTEVFISPKNYLNFTKSNFKKDWFVECRFHDPKFKDKYPAGFQYRRKFSGNNLLELKLTASIYKEEMEKMLDKKNYNPITKVYMTDRVGVLHPYMPFVTALEQSYEKLKSNYSKNHAYEVKRSVKNVSKIKDQLGFGHLLINEVKTWHIKNILDSLELTDSVYNKSRAYLMGLFKELVEFGCCENNPVRDITRRVEIKNIRSVISDEKLKYVFYFLRDKHYTFFRYGKIFFYSGGRTAELFRVQKKHVDLENQEYQVLIKKGKQYVWEKKIITLDAIHYWKEILLLCKNDNDFLFSKKLCPGPIEINPRQITIRWKKYIKKSTQIKDDTGKVIKVTEDFYSLKHLFLDKIEEQSYVPIIPIAGAAQRMANHKNPSTTGIYTTGKAARKNEDLKQLRIG